LKLCQALGYDLNTVEFAVEDGIPYAIDFMNPAPDADRNSVGEANFEWIVREVADLAIARATLAPQLPDLNWASFLNAKPVARPAKRPGAKKSGSKNSNAAESPAKVEERTEPQPA
jgi:hypothetical protein